MKEIAIKEHHLYNKAYRSDKTMSSKNVAVYILRDYTAKREMEKNPLKKYINRVGFSVSKKIGCAVVRNRAKRVLRAAFAEAKAYKNMKTGFLIVLSAKFQTANANSHNVAEEMISIFQKLGMYTDVDKKV